MVSKAFPVGFAAPYRYPGTEAKEHKKSEQHLPLTLEPRSQVGGTDPEQYKLFQHLQYMEAKLESITLPKYLGNYVNWISSNRQTSREIPST